MRWDGSSVMSNELSIQAQARGQKEPERMGLGGKGLDLGFYMLIKNQKDLDLE